MNKPFKNYEKLFKKGVVIFNENDTSKEMYFILEGLVIITKKVLDKVQTLATLTNGDFFGEMSTFTDNPRVATAVVAEDSKILEVHPDVFQSWMSDYPSFGLKVIVSLCNRLNDADKQIETLVYQNYLDKIIGILYSEITDENLNANVKTYLNFDKVLQKLMDYTNFKKEIIITLINYLAKLGVVAIIETNNVLSIEISKDIVKMGNSINNDKAVKFD